VLWVPAWAAGDYVSRIRWLSFAILVAGFLHVAVEVPPLLRIGSASGGSGTWVGVAQKKSGTFFWPVTLSFAIVQINITVDMTLGMLIGPGANSSLWYGNRLMQFPLGIFALAMGTALLPMMSQQIARGEKEASRKTLSFALRSIFFYYSAVLGRPDRASRTDRPRAFSARRVQCGLHRTERAVLWAIRSVFSRSRDKRS